MKRIPLKPRDPNTAPETVVPTMQMNAPGTVPPEQRQRMPDGPGHTFVAEFSGSPPYPAPWTIHVYNVGDPNFVGVKYPDTWQVQPLAWWAAKLRAAGVALPLPPLTASARAKVKVPLRGKKATA